MREFYRRIRPHVEEQIRASRRAMARADPVAAFSSLERAHVLGQESTVLHARVHWEMLMWGLRQRSLKEVTGQLFRLVGAVTKTSIGLVPHGNTGGANVSPFRPMAVSAQIAQLIAAAKARPGKNRE